MTTLNENDYNYINTFVRTLNAPNELSAKISQRIECDECFSVIVTNCFHDIKNCEQFIKENTIVEKNVCADIDCYATSFYFTLAREIDDDDQDEMLAEIDDQFTSNLNNYVNCIEVQASDYTIEREWCLVPYYEYLANCMRNAGEH